MGLAWCDDASLRIQVADNIPEYCLISSQLWHTKHIHSHTHTHTHTHTPASFSTHLTVPLSYFSFSDTPDKVFCCLCRYRREASVSPGCGGTHYIIDECRAAAACHAQIPGQIFYSNQQRGKKLVFARFCCSIRETDPPYVSHDAEGDGAEFTIALPGVDLHTHSLAHTRT